MIFAVGVAIGFAKKSDGSTALAAVVGYLVFSNVLTAFGPMELVDPACVGEACAMERDPTGPEGLRRHRHRHHRRHAVAAFPPAQVGALAGLLRRSPVRPDHHRGRRHRVGGRVRPRLAARWVRLLSDFGNWLYASGPIGAGLFGVANRALIPMGLHHVLNSVVWFQVGDCTNAAGQALNGDLTCFFNAEDRGDRTSGSS